MELYFIMKELEINNDNTLKKLNEIIKDIFDIELINEAKEYIKYCEINYINNEKIEIKKLLNQKEFDKAKIKYEIILNEFKNDYIIRNIKKEYKLLLKNLDNLKYNIYNVK